MIRNFNPSKVGLALALVVAAVWGLGHCPSASGIPPAPYCLIYGMAKDQFGTPLTPLNTSVVLVSPSGTQINGQILPGLAAGVNYQIKVPMDGGQTPQLYRPDALLTSNAFTLFIVVGGVTNIPIEMTSGFLQLGQPGSAMRVNLTLGVDSNGDGIPDAWEYAYLNALGTNLNLSSLNANSILGGMSLRQAYLLGLPVFDPGTTFQVSLLGFNGTSPVVEFPGMTGRSYTIVGSSDMNTWTPLTFNLPTDPPGTPAQSFYYSSGIQSVQLQVNVPAGSNSATFMKVLLQ